MAKPGTFRKVKLRGTFRTSAGAIATDMSGVASATPLGRRRRKCLVIDNESRTAQFAAFDLEKAELEAGELVPLLPDAPAAISAFGAPPDDGDSGYDDYILDGEGVAWLAPHYYVTGSHNIHDREADGEGSNTPRVALYRRSAHLVARVRRDGSKLELSYRLNEALQSGALKPYFLRSPEREAGINIEGLAGWRNWLYFGFRSPIAPNGALLLRVRADALFIKAASLEPELLRVPLGAGTGIRDLATLPDGRLLILAGPPADGAAGYAFCLFDRRRNSTLQLAHIERKGDEKPEGMMLAAWRPRSDGAARASVLVLRDHPENGRPRLYDLNIPKRSP